MTHIAQIWQIDEFFREIDQRLLYSVLNKLISRNVSKKNTEA